MNHAALEPARAKRDERYSPSEAARELINIITCYLPPTTGWVLSGLSLTTSGLS